jgi:hypothetical protein
MHIYFGMAVSIPSSPPVSAPIMPPSPLSFLFLDREGKKRGSGAAVSGFSDCEIHISGLYLSHTPRVITIDSICAGEFFLNFAETNCNEGGELI